MLQQGRIFLMDVIRQAFRDEFLSMVLEGVLTPDECKHLCVSIQALTDTELHAWVACSALFTIQSIGDTIVQFSVRLHAEQ